jgi:hypothetical protein
MIYVITERTSPGPVLLDSLAPQLRARRGETDA